VEAVAITPDGRRAATACLDGVVRVWDLAGAAPAGPRELPGHDRLVCALAFSPDGRRLASGGYDGAVRAWDPAAGTGCLLGRFPGLVAELAFSPDGERVGALYRPVPEVPAARPADGERAGHVPPGGLTRVWDLDAGGDPEEYPDCTDVVNAVAPDRRYAAGADGQAGETVVRDRYAGQPVGWYPAVLNPLAGCPGRPLWAGAEGSHLVLVRFQPA
jgi:hypothetical protein